MRAIRKQISLDEFSTIRKIADEVSLLSSHTVNPVNRATVTKRVAAIDDIGT